MNLKKMDRAYLILPSINAPGQPCFAEITD
jgi:hypothetical protein